MNIDVLGCGFLFCGLFSYVVGAMENVVEFILGKQTHFGEQKGLGPSGGVDLNTLGTLLFVFNLGVYNVWRNPKPCTINSCFIHEFFDV